MMVVSDDNPFAYTAGRPFSLFLVALIALAIYFALEAKPWQAGAPKEAAVARGDD